ncbi:Uu.00g020170.m01.CDS01 [Anthostomella pinea]|uniref:Uu.00g020170.m01.CDS01 n=1 Tax=Anthostomella pinea TaxID=933095 RepID=A0AAI8VZF8_9PEZI|nr:Uu.00g020170.m01.CDS01 [Anthostomella pinea]
MLPNIRQKFVADTLTEAPPVVGLGDDELLTSRMLKLQHHEKEGAASQVDTVMHPRSGRKSRGREQFHLPVSNSQPEPVWRPGDGFSGDEAKPDFLFLMTGKRKRQRSRSLSSMGSLDFEAEAPKKNAGASAIDRPRVQHLTEHRLKRRRGVVKDVWPTIENFTEDTISPVSEQTLLERQKIIRSTVTPEPTPISIPKPAIKIAPSRRRYATDFENFGRDFNDFQGRSKDNVLQALDQVRLLRHESTVLEYDGGEDDEEYSYASEDDHEMIPATKYGRESEHDNSGDPSEHDDSGDQSQHDDSDEQSQQDDFAEQSELDGSEDQSELNGSDDKSELDDSDDRNEHADSEDSDENETRDLTRWQPGREDSDVPNLSSKAHFSTRFSSPDYHGEPH